MSPDLAAHKKKVVRRSAFVLAALYVLYTLPLVPFLVSSISEGSVPLLLAGLGALLPLFLFAVQYWVGPFLIGRFTKVDWTGPAALPEESRSFLAAICKSENIQNLRVGVVNTRVPNAFAYGWRRRPHLVVTRGLVERLPEDELKAVLAHEVGHLRSRDFLILTMAMVIPMIFVRVGWRLFLRGGSSNIGLFLRAMGAYSYACIGSRDWCI
jgi:Zn-dependent protease with chaperone function